MRERNRKLKDDVSKSGDGPRRKAHSAAELGCITVRDRRSTASETSVRTSNVVRRMAILPIGGTGPLDPLNTRRSVPLCHPGTGRAGPRFLQLIENGISSINQPHSRQSTSRVCTAPTTQPGHSESIYLDFQPLNSYEFTSAEVLTTTLAELALIARV